MFLLFYVYMLVVNFLRQWTLVARLQADFSRSLTIFANIISLDSDLQDGHIIHLLSVQSRKCVTGLEQMVQRLLNILVFGSQK